MSDVFLIELQFSEEFGFWSDHPDDSHFHCWIIIIKTKPDSRISFPIRVLEILPINAQKRNSDDHHLRNNSFRLKDVVSLEEVGQVFNQ